VNRGLTVIIIFINCNWVLTRWQSFEPEFGLIIRKCDDVVCSMITPVAIDKVYEDFK